MREATAVNKKGHGKNYGLRVFAYAMYAGFNGVETIIIAFLGFYMTNSLFLGAGIAGALVAVAKVFDGFSDLVAGALVDRTHTRWGKARPYAFAGVAMWIAVVLLFSAAPSWSNGLKIAYVFVMYLLTDTVFKTLVTAADPAHYRHGFNAKEQMDSVAIWGTVGGLIATVAGIILPQLLVSYAFIEHGWTIITVILAVPGIVFCMLKFFVIPETEEVEEVTVSKEQMTLSASVKYLFRNKYIFIYGVVLLLVIVLQSMSSIQTYYFTYIIKDLGKMSTANTFQLASIVVMPLYPVFMKKFGKRRFAVGSFILGGLFSIIPLFMPMSYVMIGIATMIRQICYGSVNVATALYTIDCMKYTEWKDNVRLEGILAAVVSVATKIGAAISLLMSGVVLQLAGFNGALEVQPESALSAMSIMYLVVPIFVMLFCALMMHFWKVEKHMPEIEKELAARTQQAAAVSTDK